jgi:hypothetical protein
MAIAEPAHELVKVLAESGETGTAFSLFRALTAPFPASSLPQRPGAGPLRLFGAGAIAASPLEPERTGAPPVRSAAISSFDWFMEYYQEEVLREASELLMDLDPAETVSVLEAHLCTAIRLEADVCGSKELERSSWWRVAIEKTDQDMERDYKSRLLRALRDALTVWAEKDAAAVQSLVDRYLGESREILRRLGLYLLHRFPRQYSEYVTQELGKAENLDDGGVRHEVFMLLRRGYPVLEPAHQDRLVAAILSGPPLDRVRRHAQRLYQEYGRDPQEYAESYCKKWRLDRLWMLRGYLEGEPAEFYRELVDELGEPERPGFRRSSSRVYRVRDVSPITEEELASMPPEELFEYVKDWQPGPEKQLGPEDISTRGLAAAVARVVLASPQQYEKQMAPIALHHPEYACALLEQMEKGDQETPVPWEISISLCEELLGDETVRTSVERRFDGNWIRVRRLIVDLVQAGLNNPERAVSPDLVPRVRTILLGLVDDPDPDTTSDRPPKGWAGYQDPATVAINHVRPKALIALIEYARHYANLLVDVGYPEPIGLQEPVVGKTLTRKLDRKEDPSRAVHSVFGLYLPLLYWLDREWVESHLGAIFPESDDDETRWFFAAAWDSFVTFNRLPRYMLEMLRPHYERAISNLSSGFVSESHNDPAKHLGAHLVWEFVLGDYDLLSLDGQQGLLPLFFNQCPSRPRGNATWMMQRILEDNPSEREQYWPKARSLWEWRVRQASRAGNSTDFDEEMQWFARFPLEAPDSETITTLLPLLEGLLPHITRSRERDMGWGAIEQYLAQEVERDPVKTIEFYLLMHHQGSRPRWLPGRQEEGKIINTAVAHDDARVDALALIDLLACSCGVYEYREVYERFAR